MIAVIHVEDVNVNRGSVSDEYGIRLLGQRDLKDFYFILTLLFFLFGFYERPPL